MGIVYTCGEIAAMVDGGWWMVGGESATGLLLARRARARTRGHVFALDGGVAVHLRGVAGEVDGRVLAAVCVGI